MGNNSQTCHARAPSLRSPSPKPSGETTRLSTKRPKDGRQVAGYPGGRGNEPLREFHVNIAEISLDLRFKYHQVRHDVDVDVDVDVDDYIEFYNHRRFHESLKYKKPMKVYRDGCLNLKELKKAA